MLIYIYCLIGFEIVKCNLISKIQCDVISTKSCNTVVQPQVLIDGTPLSQVDKQKIWECMVFDSKLTWSSHVAAVCKSIAYYLCLINFHSKSLPREILKMLVESLVFSRPYQFGGQRYIKILYPDITIYITEQSIFCAFVDCISHNMFQTLPSYWMAFCALVNSISHIMCYVRSIHLRVEAFT